MELIDRVQIHRFHKARIAQFGQGTPEALAWKSDKKQQLRFEILARIGDINGRSVLDAGCGHGDLKGFLDQWFTGFRYAGVDLIEEFLDVATERYGGKPDTTFYLGDCAGANLPNMDYVLCSGMLNYHTTTPDYVTTMIRKLFNNCSVGLGFNLLSRVNAEDQILVAADMDQIVAYCGTLAHRVMLHKGYLDDDFTIFMYH